MAQPETSSSDSPWVKVYLRDTKSHELIPHRTIILHSPTLEQKIGRGSQAEVHLHPSELNAWFSSRVMSREHAVLRAHPATKKVTIEDTGSMHGTFINGKRLGSGQPTEIHSGEKVQFGAEIVRGDQVYTPLEVGVRLEWVSRIPSSSSTFCESTVVSKNTFRVDYSDDDEDEDESEEMDENDVEILYESVRNPHIHERRHNATYAILDSESSDSEQEPEEEQDLQLESAPSSHSSPAQPHVQLENGSTISSFRVDSTISTKANAGAKPGSTIQTALNLDDDLEVDVGDPSKNEARNTNSAIEDEALTKHQQASDNDENECDSDDSSPDFASDADSDEDGSEERPQADTSKRPTIPIVSPNLLRTCDLSRPASPVPPSTTKPNWYQPPAHLPTIHTLMGQCHQPQMLFPNDGFSVQPQPAMPQLQPYNFYYGSSWLNNETHSTYPAPFEHAYATPLETNNQQQVPMLSRSYKDLPAYDHPRPVSKQIETCETVLKVDHAKPTKVSINDIIEEVSESTATPCPKRKRKSCEMSDSSLIGENSLSRQELTGIVHEFSGCRYRDTTSSDDLANGEEKLTPDLEIPPNEAQIVEPQSARPNKKAKSGHESQGCNIAKYVATAVVGAAFGAVGTVFGLAALPAGYFE